jgi:peptide/nickel transport system permease protein
MTTFIIRRLVMAIIVVIMVSLLVFFGMRILPGDPIEALVGSQDVFSEEQVIQLKHEFGLDKPLLVQYFVWMGGILHGDFGKSIVGRVPVADEIFKRLPITLHLGSLAFLIGMIVGIPAGIISAVRRGKHIDTIVVTLSNIGITIPVFLLGYLLIYLFSLHLEWLPVQGYISPWEDFWLNLRQIIMPVCCLSIFPIALLARQTRSSMLEVMRHDYIRTALAKGLKERVLIIRHALKNALIPVITIAGMGVTVIIGGTVVIETVFNIPGMGRLAVNSVLTQDYPYIQGIILIISVGVLLVNLFVDLLYGYLDPRIRYG